MVPREIGRPWLAVLGALLLLAAPSGADNCNSDCRMRQNFFSCLTSQCFYMERADCGKCTANNSVCDTATLAMTGTCQAQGTNQVRIYSDCLYDCNCDGSRIAVEAQSLTVFEGTWIGRDWMRCLSDPPPP